MQNRSVQDIKEMTSNSKLQKILYTYSMMVSRELSCPKICERSPGKLLPEAEGRGQPFFKASPHTKIKFSTRSHRIRVLLPYLLYNFYKNTLL